MRVPNTTGVYGKGLEIIFAENNKIFGIFQKEMCGVVGFDIDEPLLVQDDIR